MIRAFKLPLLFALLCPLVIGQQSDTSADKEQQPVFREPFKLRVQVDKGHYYEEHYEKRIPYVFDGDIYLFSGENFGINVSKSDGSINVKYQPKLNQADVTFTLKQDVDNERGTG